MEEVDEALAAVPDVAVVDEELASFSDVLVDEGRVDVVGSDEGFVVVVLEVVLVVLAWS